MTEEIEPFYCSHCGDEIPLNEPLNAIADVQPDGLLKVQFWCAACASAGVGLQ